MTALLLLPLALAHEALDVSAAWRPTLRRGYVLYGDSAEQIPLGGLIAGQEPSAGAGLANNALTLARLEAAASLDLGDGLAGHVGVLGGAFQLQLTEDGTVHAGSDWNLDLGGSIARELAPDLGFEAVMAGRVRIWDLEDLPVHGNVGLVLGVRPTYKRWSLFVESTLAAVWMTGLTDWGAQKDSSILRLRPEYTWHHDRLLLSAGLDYYHTHTEFFGTKLIPGQTAFMLDDFDLALVIGVGFEGR